MTPSPTARPSRRPTLGGLLAAIGGVALFIYFIRRAGLAGITEGIGRLGWTFLVVVALGGVRFLVRAAAWIRCLEGSHHVRLWDAFQGVIAGDALGNLTPLSLIVSEPAKAMFVRHREPIGRTLPALAIENLFYSLSAILVHRGWAGGSVPDAADTRSALAGNDRPDPHLGCPRRHRALGPLEPYPRGKRHAAVARCSRRRPDADSSCRISRPERRRPHSPALSAGVVETAPGSRPRAVVSHVRGAGDLSRALDHQRAATNRSRGVRLRVDKPVHLGGLQIRADADRRGRSGAPACSRTCLHLGQPPA